MFRCFTPFATVFSIHTESIIISSQYVHLFILSLRLFYQHLISLGFFFFFFKPVFFCFFFFQPFFFSHLLRFGKYSKMRSYHACLNGHHQSSKRIDTHQIKNRTSNSWGSTHTRIRYGQTCQAIMGKQ